MKVGLVGCGRWGSLIRRDLESLGVHVSVVAHRGDSTADLATCDGVVVAVPSGSHAEVIESVLDLGVPVFVEKPMTVDVDSARRITEAAGDRVFVMDKWRYHPGVRELARLVADGSLGTVHGVELTRVQAGNPHDDVDVSWILLPHDLTIARDVLGALPRPVTARAVVTGGRVESMVALLGDSPWCHIRVSSLAAEPQRRVEVFGTDGIATLDDGWADHVTLRRRSAGGDGTFEVVERIDTPGELPLLAELRAFVGHLEGGPAPVSSAAEGLEVVAVIAELRSMVGLHA